MRIQKIGVVGCGLMGHGIVQVAAQAGFEVVVLEAARGLLDAGIGRIEKSMAKLAEKAVAKGKQTQAQADAAQEQARARIQPTTEMGELGDCDLVIEAIVENMAAKRALLGELNLVCRPETIFASNTSSLSVAEMGEASGRPARMVGLHFFNPVQLMRLVEVVRTAATSDEVWEAAYAFGQACGKTPVACRDTPGFIVNRLLVPYMVQAIQMLDRGDATKEDIDTGMCFGCGHPMGPITLSDYVGLDTTLSILEGWVERYPDEPTVSIPESLRRLVAAGKLGRKTGEGYYRWEGDRRL